MAALPDQVIADLYAAFEAEPKPHVIRNDLWYGMDRSQVATLLHKPLRQLTWEDLHPYVENWSYASGSAVDLRYFLPRILELIPRSDFAERVGSHIAAIPWSALPTQQQNAVSMFFEAAFTELLSRERMNGNEIDSWLCCASHFLPRWRNLLDRIANEPSALLALAGWHIDELRQRQLPGIFWEGSPRQKELFDWLLSSQVQELLPYHMRTWK